MEKNNLKAVVFDLDGVLTDSAKYHYQAWKMLADKLGIPFDEEYNEKLKGVSRMESLELILQNGNAQDKYTQEEKVAMATEKNEFYKQLLHQIAREVRDGNIDADPCCRSEDDSFCKYCDWADACHFQDGRDGDHLHYILPVKPEDFWRQVEEETGEGGGN